MWHLRDTKSVVPMFAFCCVSRPLVWLLRFNNVTLRASSPINGQLTLCHLHVGTRTKTLKPFKTRATISSPPTLHVFKGRIMTTEMASGKCVGSFSGGSSDINSTEWRTGPVSLNLSSEQKNIKNETHHSHQCFYVVLIVYYSVTALCYTRVQRCA